MTALFEVMTDCAVSFFKLFFSWNVVGDVSIADITIAIFIIRAAYVYLIKGGDAGIMDDLLRFNRRRNNRRSKNGS